MKYLLLISNSSSPGGGSPHSVTSRVGGSAHSATRRGGGYLDHVEGAIRSFLQPIPTVLFIPYALSDWDAYSRTVAGRLERMGIGVVPIHQAADQIKAIRQARAVFVGGGNTFRLLKALEDRKLLSPIRRAVLAGTLRYVGSSAGANLSCPTIQTTNDMPIVQPGSFSGLGLVPFQINPHFVDGRLLPTHMGETREDRIREYHEENMTPVVGLREGSWLLVRGRTVRLFGKSGARVFRRGKQSLEWSSGSRRF